MSSEFAIRFRLTDGGTAFPAGVRALFEGRQRTGSSKVTASIPTSWSTTIRRRNSAAKTSSSTAAIQEILEELKTKRYDLPPVPPYPNRNPEKSS